MLPLRAFHFGWMGTVCHDRCPLPCDSTGVVSPRRTKQAIVHVEASQEEVSKPLMGPRAQRQQRRCPWGTAPGQTSVPCPVRPKVTPPGLSLHPLGQIVMACGIHGARSVRRWEALGGRVLGLVHASPR